MTPRNLENAIANVRELIAVVITQQMPTHPVPTRFEIDETLRTYLDMRLEQILDDLQA
jgi:hypothetical protein